MPNRSWGSIRQLPSKKYQASYIGPDHQRHTAPITFTTKGQAQKWLAGQRTLIETNNWQSPKLQTESNPLFQDYAKNHIELQTKQGQQLRKNTKDLYTRLLKNQLSHFHNLRVTDLKKTAVDKWYQGLLNTKKITTAGKAYSLLSAIMNRAVEDGIIKTNPCKIRGARNAVTGVQRHTPTPEQIQATLNNLNARYKQLIVVAAISGLRFSELIALQASDVKKHLVDGQEVFALTVNKAVTYSNGVYTLAGTKSKASAREVYLPASITQYVEAQLQGKADTDLVFPSAAGTYLNHGTAMNALRRAWKKANIQIKGFSMHSFRHYAATQITAMGATLPTIKKFIGDSSNKAAMTYVHDLGQAPFLIQKVPTLAIETTPVKKENTDQKPSI
jgi:integrase